MKKQIGIVTFFFSNAIASEELRNSGLNEIGTLTSAISVKSPKFVNECGRKTSCLLRTRLFY